MATAVRWTIHISQDTDSALRDFLNAPNLDSEEVSRFIEEAIRWRILDCAVETIKNRNQDIPAEELEAAIDRAVAEERKGMNRGAS